MSGKKWGLCALILMIAIDGFAQKMYKYRVRLTDKRQTVYSLDRPEEFLSSRALERRARQGLAVDSTDLPVCASYVRTLVDQGGKFLLSSKWNNTVLMQVEDTLVANRFLENSFVESVRKVWVSPDTIVPRKIERKREIKDEWKTLDFYYGAGTTQIYMHHGDSLHAAGFRGEGMQIAVIDAGFYNVDAIKIFQNLNLLGVRDFVNPSSDIYAEHDHGLKVLSCMAANTPYVMVGTAPAASYWLLRSEDNDTEQMAEEDYWAAAVEFADSVGVDVVNTSLGYYSFDNVVDNYQYKDLDGRTSLMTRSATYAADKGLLVVCSAGNAGQAAWKKITPPGDAENVLTVGAVDYDRLNATFSSVGNTADGRIKPDIMAMGVRASVVGTNGNISFANGTSFASPIFCGLVTCLWQACPWLSVRQLIDVVHQAGDRADNPDNIFGYGITDIWKAYRLGLKLRPEDGK